MTGILLGMPPAKTGNYLLHFAAPGRDTQNIILTDTWHRTPNVRLHKGPTRDPNKSSSPQKLRRSHKRRQELLAHSPAVSIEQYKSKTHNILEWVRLLDCWTAFKFHFNLYLNRQQRFAKHQIHLPVTPHPTILNQISYLSTSLRP